jgi:hypothetical protein
MKKLRFRQWVFTLAAPAAALALIVASCAQQSESPVAPSAVRSGGTLFGGTSGDPTPEPTGEPSPDPTPEPTGEPCSPGYWKNHLDHFYSVCSAAAALPGDDFTTCDELLTALTCQGSDASCGRSAAAAALNTVSGCTED